MRDLANQIDDFLNEIILRSENQHEILIGTCTSDVSLTNTQEHILMLLSDEKLTNSDLAKRLKVSQAAVTKAVKSLIQQGMLEAVKDAKDARMIYYRLTDLGQPVADEHRHHHAHTVETYEKIVAGLSDTDQEVVSRFLTSLMEEVGK